MQDSQQTQEPPPAPGPDATDEQRRREGIDTEALLDYRRLRRSRSDRRLAGVAGGLARHLDIDPLLVRVVLVVLVFFGGAGVVLYGALWLLLPEDDEERGVVPTSEGTRNHLVWVVLVLAAVLALGDVGLGTGVFWPPLVVVGAVVLAGWLLTRDRREHREHHRDEAWSTAAAAPAAPAGPTAPGTYAPRPPRRRRKQGPLLLGGVLAAIALGCGVLGLLDSTGTDVPDAAYPALALAITGAGLVVGSFFGRAGGLVLLGIVLSVGLAATSIGEPGYDGDRDLVVEPTRASGLERSYDVPAGRILVDLTDVRDLDALDGRTLDLSSNAGEILVLVPEGLAVDFDGDIDYGGAIDLPGATRDGWGPTLSGRVGEPGEPLLSVDATLDFGHIELRQS